MDALPVFQAGCKAVRSAYRGARWYGREFRDSWVVAFQPVLDDVLDGVGEKARQHLLAREEAEEVLEGTDLARGLEQFARGERVSSDWLFEDHCNLHNDGSGCGCHLCASLPASPVGAPTAGVDPVGVSMNLPTGDASRPSPVGTTTALEMFDEFVRDYVDPSLHAHFADNDDNRAEYVRRAIRRAAGEVLS